MSAAPAARRRLSTLDAYLLRLLARPLAAALALTVTALMLEKALRLVHELSAAGARLAFVGPVMAGMAPYYLDTALPVGFFVALFVVVTSLDASGEVEAMMAAGLSLDRIAAPFVAVGVGLGLAALVIGGWPEPWGRYVARSAHADARRAGWVARVEGGTVVSPRPGLAFEADRVHGARLEGVFLARTEADGSETVATARSGRLSLVNAGRDVRIALSEGVILRTHPGDPAPLTRFDSLAQVEPAGGDGETVVRGSDERELTLPGLGAVLTQPAPRDRAARVRAQLAVTLVQAAATPLLPLLALPLGLAAKRGGRSPGMLLAGAVLAGFHHLLQFLNGLAVAGKLSDPWPIWASGLGFAALCAALYSASRRRPGDNPVSRAAAAFAPLADLARHAWAKRPTLEVRLPGRAGLTGYVTRLLALRTLAAGAGILAFLQLVDLQEATPQVLARGLGLAGLVRYEALRLPAMAVQATAFALLLGAVFTFASLTRRSENVAMQAAGLSPYRMVLGALPVAVAAAGMLLIDSAEVAPRAQAALDAWWTATAPTPAGPAQAGRWLRVGPDVLHADAPSADGRALGAMRLYRRMDDGRLIARTAAADARWTGRGWTLNDAVTHTVAPVTPVVTHAAALAWSSSLAPRDVARLTLAREETPGLSAAWTRLAGRPSDKPPGFLQTRLHRLIAEPLAPLVMLLLASPVLVGAGVRRSRNAPVAFALGAGLLFMVADGFLTALGEAGDLPPMVAAWTAPVLFAGLGATALLFAEG